MQLLKRNFVIGLILASAMSISCSPKNKDDQADERETSEEVILSTPDVPMMINTPERQASFLAEHYWDNIDFQDTTILQQKDNLDRFFIDYLFILSNLSNEEATKSIELLSKNLSKNTSISKFIYDLSEKYLNHPNSPIRNDMIYEQFLKGALASKVMDEATKTRYRYQFDLLQKNKPGDLAEDFSFALINDEISF